MLELLMAGHGVESWVPTGDISEVELRGSQLFVATEVNSAERERRHALGVDAFEDRRALEVLLSMPGDASVPLGLFSASQQRVLRSLPSWVVERSGDHVRRVLSPPVSLLSAGFEASTWRQGFRKSALLASYCARYVVVDTAKEAEDLVLETLEARFYGVGLSVLNDAGLEWLVSPAPFNADWFSASAWLMTEQVWSALRGVRR